MKHGTIIIGASHAGVQAAASLRDYGYSEPIRLLHSGAGLPYHRPPLSKAYLAGEVGVASLSLRGPEYFSRHDIDLVERAWVSSIDHRLSEVGITIAGRCQAPMRYDSLIIATGAAARPLALVGSDLKGVVYLRDIADADRLRGLLEEADNLVIIGGGFIGLEVASTARKMGREVHIVETQNRLLSRVVAPPVSDYLARQHRQAGAHIWLETRPTGIEGERGCVSSVALSSGEKLRADLVLVCVGAQVNEALAASAGLSFSEGINVDERCRSDVTNVYAIGDCVRTSNPFFKQQVRLESVHNANETARIAAADIAKSDIPRKQAPWFWSDQLNTKLQMVGRSRGYDRAVTRGSADQNKFSVLYYEGAQLIGVDSVNNAADHMAARRLLDADTSPPPDAGADSTVPLRSFLSSDAG